MDAEPGYAFWEVEGCEFELADGPEWLGLDPLTNTLCGTPGQQDTGTHRVTVVCHRTYPQELKEDDYRSSYFLKDKAEFSAQTEQTFELQVK